MWCSLWVHAARVGKTLLLRGWLEDDTEHEQHGWQGKGEVDVR